MEHYPLIQQSLKALKVHQGKAITKPAKHYFQGLVDALTAVDMYMKNSDMEIAQFIAPSTLLIVPACVKDVCAMLREMRSSDPDNPDLTFKFIADSALDHAWFPVEYDGEYRMWGYLSQPHFAGLQTFTVQSLPQDVRIDTEWIPKTYKEMK